MDEAAQTQALRKPSEFPDGTPLPRRAISQIEAAHDDDEHDDLALTTPVTRLEAEEIGTKRIVHRASSPPTELGTRTLMGVMNAVPHTGRARSAAGVETAKPIVHAHPAPQGMRRVTTAHPAANAKAAPQPARAPITAVAPSFRVDEPVARVEPELPPEPLYSDAVTSEPVQHWSDWDQWMPAPSARRNARADKVLSKSYRVLGFSALGVIVLVLAGYIATTAFYFFSTSWVMPVVVSQTDDRVVALKQELATQQTHRERLAAEVADIDRAVASLESKRDDLSKRELEKVHASRKSAQAALARQDEIVRGLQQAALLRAARPLDGRAAFAQVPYENLKGVKAGTKIFGCSYQMLWCRQVGAVVEVLPGEITFKHPKRDATVRGQLIQLEMMVPEASSNTMLYLDGAPLLL